MENKKPTKPIKTYTTPPANLLINRGGGSSEGLEVIKGEEIAALLTKLKSPCTFQRLDILPQFFQYHFNYIDISRAGNLKKALSALSMVLHQETPIKQEFSEVAHFSIIINRDKKAIVPFNNVLYDSNFDTSSPYTSYLGVGADNKKILLDFSQHTHFLIAGTSGSGKSVLINTLISGLLYKATPQDVKMVMIDPKMVEFSRYSGLPHLLAPIVTDTGEAVQILNELADLMDRRYEQLNKRGLQDITQCKEYPHIIIIIDELADLMLTSRAAVEDSIIRISQKGRAAGLHLIIATQNPTVKVLTGLIKANIPNKIALKTASMRYSINILDHKGAEDLAGKGDGLLKLSDNTTPQRFQTAYIKNDDLVKIIEYWRGQA